MGYQGAGLAAGAGRWPRCAHTLIHTALVNRGPGLAGQPQTKRSAQPRSPIGNDSYETAAVAMTTALVLRVSGPEGNPSPPGHRYEALQRHLSDLKSERDTTATLRSVTAGPHSSHQSRHAFNNATTSSRRLCLPALAPLRAPALRCLFQTNRYRDTSVTAKETPQ